MSEQIKVGDLVVVVRNTHCCGRGKSLGKIFRVHHFEPFLGTCGDCGARGDGRQLACMGASWFGYDVRRLKRIPPMNELDGVKNDEEITA